MLFALFLFIKENSQFLCRFINLYHGLQTCFPMLFLWAASLNIWSHVQVFKMLIKNIKTKNTTVSEQFQNQIPKS